MHVSIFSFQNYFVMDFILFSQKLNLNFTEINECDNELSEKELYISLTSMQNNKSPGNDGLTKEFFVTFWEDIKDVFLNSCRTAKLKKGINHFAKTSCHKAN